MKYICIKVAILFLCMLSIVGCSEQEKRNIEFYSLYNEESGSFELNGYSPATDWRVICKDLGILDKVKEDKNRFYINRIVEIFPNSEGFVSSGEVILGGIPARVSYSFYREKLYSVRYMFELEGKKNEENRVIALTLEDNLSKEFSDFASYEYNEICGFHSAGKSWFAGYEGSMSRLSLSTNIDSDNGELHIVLSVICDIPGNERVTAYYIDNLADQEFLN